MPSLAEASSFSGKVDEIFLVITGISLAVLFMITFLLIYFSVRYSRRRNPVPVDIEGNFWLEVAWTVTPLVLFLGMFYFGWTNFYYMRNAPANAMVIEVTARQWAWSFKYPNGKQTEDLYLALNRPFRFNLHSLDVIHGFYIPAFRIKEDVVPGKENHAWVQPSLLGAFDLQCTVICGPGHAKMLAKVYVVPVRDFEEWYFGGEDAPLPKFAGRAKPAASSESAGFAVLQDKGCLSCHSTDGSPHVGPTFLGLFGSRVVLVSGAHEREVVVDEALARKAITEPGKETIKGYPPTMPKVALTARELDQIVDYLKSLRDDEHR
jgi:cytochrome c oxidase subunit II